MVRVINFKGVDMEVEYDYYPASPMVIYYKDGSGHPGDPSQVEIINIYISGVDVWELLTPHHNEIGQELLNLEE